MTLAERKRLHRKFFKELGPTGKTLRDMFYAIPTVAFYMKNLDCRIMAINRRNCEICNIKDEWDAIGLKSSDLFPSDYANTYMALDREVIRTGRPVLHRLLRHPADRSMQTEIANVYPLRNHAGKVVGTARAYFLAPDTDAPLSRYGQIRSVAAYVEAHYDEAITIPQLVEMTGMSETVFKKTFAKVFSMTPGHYLTTIRLNAVRRLLEMTDKLLSEIAAETGFFDQSHLSRIFKKERGMTPGEYRRKHRSIAQA